MATKYNSCNDPELWGGMECTINRVGDEYKDQLALAGHYNRPDDFKQFAELGLKKIRYPILWERHAPVQHQRIDWSATDRGMSALQEQKLSPIVGLLHHGSGPAYTSLLNPDFAFRLAEYAFEVSGHFPQVIDYTPVNEPLTTARFSGLYGHWYPHHQSGHSFLRMLLNQLKGTILSMQAIRSINPLARLVQTEDLGKTQSTPALAAQTRFENDRRWLTYDILCGRLVPGHPLWNWFTMENGISERELRFFSETPCPPDILGLNHYITSERWLDENLTAYPSATHGGNGHQKYADTELVRARPEQRLGITKLGLEVWERYRIPLALTEVHLHCTREEQMRWLAEMWQESVGLCRADVPVLGFTVWSLLGAFDWDTLLTGPDNHYESGVFALQQGQLRETALGRLLTGLQHSNQPVHPLLQKKGWWHNRPTTPIGHAGPLLKLEGEDSCIADALIVACRSRGIDYLYTREISGGVAVWPAETLERDAWATLRFESDRTRSFYSQAFVVTALMSAPLEEVIRLVLDLLIDNVTGSWNIDHSGALTSLAFSRPSSAFCS